MIEIKFRGRGGQGAVVASEILGRTFFLEGKYPQSFSVFGGERRGAPVLGFLRVDEEPILLKCLIYHPDQMIIFDFSLVDEGDIFRELKPDGTILINTHQDINFFRGLREYKLGLIDAGPIARNLGLGAALNTVMLGAYVRLTHGIQMKTLSEAVMAMAPTKKEENVEAAQKGYEGVKIYDLERKTH
jgi:2-oxoacid:acceptor oxidoreductase gamma subunit (pyruvate/2-ketoisovalerate family)